MGLISSGYLRKGAPDSPAFCWGFLLFLVRFGASANSGYNLRFSLVLDIVGFPTNPIYCYGHSLVHAIVGGSC